MTRNGRKLTLVAAVALLLGAAIALAWIVRPDRHAGPCRLASGPVMVPDLPEASGLAVSRRNPGLLWAHNDSGNAAILFAIDSDGTVHGRVALAARLRDWEDLSAARCADEDCLYIADIGDNARERRSVRIYRVPEPTADLAQTARLEIFDATYADGPHNAEAMFVIADTLFIVTRDRVGGVYRASVPSSSTRQLTFERIGELGLAAVTDAETSRDGGSVVVRTSQEAVLYRTTDLSAGRIVPYLRIPIGGLKEAQGEGVALDGRLLYLASEGQRWNRAGRVVTLECDLPE